MAPSGWSQARRAASAARAIALFEADTAAGPVWREQSAYWDGVASKGPLSLADDPVDDDEAPATE